MNKSTVFVYLLASFISAVRSLEEISTAERQHEYSLAEKDIQKQGAIEIKEMISTLLNKDDILSISELNKIYNSLENIFAKTKYLKDQTENDKKIVQKADMLEESRTAKKVKSVENLENKVEEKTSSPVTLNVESKGDSIKSKTADSVGRKTTEVTSDTTSVESATDLSGIGIKSADFLENDNNEDDSIIKIIPAEKSAKDLEFALSNDESNSEWDLLDDIPLTRRMLSHSELDVMDTKGKSAEQHVERVATAITTPKLDVMPLDDRNLKGIIYSSVPFKNNMDMTKTAEEHVKPIAASRTTPKFDSTSIDDRSYNDASTINPTVLIPLVHPAVARRRFQIIPGVVVSTAVPLDFRKLLRQEAELIQDENNEISEKTSTSSEITSVENKDSELSNAYPYSPMPETPQVPQISSVGNTVFSKLAQASEHPHRITSPVQYFNNNAGMFYNLRPTYSPLPVIDMHKYITAYGR